MVAPALRVFVDGESDKTYKKGDKVTGRVVLVVEEEVQVDTLKVVFAGSSITKTTRPLHVNGNTNTPTGRHEYEEKIRLFNRENELAVKTTLGPKKYMWTFDFAFPDLTEQRFKRLTHGVNYPREPHPLPPSFQIKTNAPGGAAQIQYFIQARLLLAGSKDTQRCKHILRYHPTPPGYRHREARIASAVLYGQTWKPNKEKEPIANKTFSRRHSSKSPRIVPVLMHPESIAPGQHIPLSLSLKNMRDATNEGQDECTLDSLSVTISTFSSIMCGHTFSQPEDVVSKHVTCIARTNMNKPLRFGESQTLTSNFRLIDDAECVPTFKTYTITRRYALNVSIGIKYGSQHFTVRSSTPLEILPRIPRDMFSPALEDGDDVEQLPAYKPREPSKEFAPDYESIYASSSHALSLVGSRSSSLFSAASNLSTAASTPASELEEMNFGRVVVREVT